MQRPGAYECHQLEVAVVESAVGREQADRTCHVLGRHLHDGLRALLEGKAEPCRDRRHGSACTIGVERHLAAEEVRGIQPAEDEICIGDRSVGTAESVGGRPRIGAGALRTDS